MGTASKFREFTLAVRDTSTHKISWYLDIAMRYSTYAFILHDRDPGVDTHAHIYIRVHSPRTIRSIARDFDIPENFVEWVRSRDGILAYLTHSNRPDKFQYSTSDITSNFDISTSLKNSNESSLDMYNDYMSMSPQQFIKKYSDFISDLPFMQKISLFSKLNRH